MALGTTCVIPTVAEIALGHDAKGAYGGEHPAFLAVDLVHTITFPHWPPLASARQVEVLGEHIARIATGGMIAVAGSAPASAASVAVVFSVAVRRARIVSIPHDRGSVAE